MYNVDSDEVRVVAMLPTYSWGGGGWLGASVAHGYLHRLPARCRGTNGISVEPDRLVAPNARDAMPAPPADVAAQAPPVPAA